MLWHEGRLVFIDVGQSVEPSHPHGLEFLYRDCANVSRFFGSVDKCRSAQELFNFVTGLNIHEDSEEAFLIQVKVGGKGYSKYSTPWRHSLVNIYIIIYFYIPLSRL